MYREDHGRAPRRHGVAGEHLAQPIVGVSIWAPPDSWSHLSSTGDPNRVYRLCCRDGAAERNRPAGASPSDCRRTKSKVEVTLPFIEEDRAGDAADQAPGSAATTSSRAGSSSSKTSLARRRAVSSCLRARSFQTMPAVRHQLVQLAVDDASR